MLMPLKTPQATLAFGARCAKFLKPPVLIFLHGDLGAGKTTFVRGLLQGFGHEGLVTSPTYTLIETYELTAGTLFHLDLYRLGDAGELAFLGLDELFSKSAYVLIEWPELARAALPAPDLEIYLHYRAEAREAEIVAGSALGRRLLGTLESLES